ncbi:MAG: phosphoribosyltransferase family protein, partial [Bacillota bacterium]|nr:phosphoribosyltransferase family protein [Bacillota bacterium]
ESPICGRCRNLKHYFNKNISLFKYNDESKNVALNLKYKNYSFIRPIAGLLGDKIKQNVQIDAVTFVPMYKEEELKKGICITYFLAKYTAEKINVPCKEYLIQKRRTAKQKELTANQRIINVHGAYESSGDVKGKRILIIDDVFTTGATLNECSKVLIKSGAKDVYTATIAIRTKE